MHFLIVLVLQPLPLTFIVLAVPKTFFQLGEHSAQHLKRRLDYEAYESNLRLRYIHIVSIKKLVHRDIQGPFFVSLIKKLSHDLQSPLFTQPPVLSGVAYISEVESQLQNQFFILSHLGVFFSLQLPFQPS